MRVIETVSRMREALKYCGRSIGFVPTMGYLHEGHLSLVRAAREQNESLVTSIFVNPAQFGPHEDYRTYPRDIESDLNKLEKMGVDLVFTPSVEEMYPDGLDTQITVGSIGDRLEGLSRPGHFNGVATIVCKFISILSPDNIYFGQKDCTANHSSRRWISIKQQEFSDDFGGTRSVTAYVQNIAGSEVIKS